MKKWGPASH